MGFMIIMTIFIFSHSQLSCYDLRRVGGKARFLTNILFLKVKLVHLLGDNKQDKISEAKILESRRFVAWASYSF